MAPADRGEKGATVRKNFGEQLLETALDKEGIVLQMERNSVLPQPHRSCGDNRANTEFQR